MVNIKLRLVSAGFHSFASESFFDGLRSARLDRHEEHCANGEPGEGGGASRGLSGCRGRGVALGFGFWRGFRVWGGFRKGLGFRVWGLGFGVWGSPFRVRILEGSGGF